MGAIAEWLNDEQQAQQAKVTIDDTMAELEQRSGTIDQIAPLQVYDDRDFMDYVIERIRPVASLVGFGGEIPATQVGKFTKLAGELFKSGLTFNYPEERMWAMMKAMELAALKNLAGQATTVQDQLTPTGQVIRGTNNTLADYLFGTLEDLIRSQITLLDALTWQAIQFGQIAYSDPRTNSNVYLKYTESNPSYNHFPADLTGTGSWNSVWTDYTNANGLRVIEEDVETYVDSNNGPPGWINMSRKLFRHLANQDATKRAIAFLTNAGTSALVDVSPEMLNRLMESRMLPPVRIVDEKYNLEDTSKNFTPVRFHNDDRYSFASNNMGERAIGPTMEAKGAPGIFIKTKEVRDVPPQDASVTTATMLPVFQFPKRFFSRKVI